MNQLKGLFIPLVTPFTDDGRSVSEIRLARQVRFWREHPIQGFYLCGATGEFLGLSASERKGLIEVVQRESQGAIPIVTNVSSLSTSVSIDLAQHASRHGAIAAFVTPPYFGVYTAAEHLAHIKAVASFGNLPILLADPFGSIDEDLESAFSTTSHTAVCTARSFDQWSVQEAVCNPADACAALMPEIPTSQWDVLAEEHGWAPIVKSLFERHGIDLGCPRSPKLSLHPRLLDAIVKAA